MFGRLNLWFGNLSGPKKAATVLVAIATGVSAIVGAVNGALDLWDKLAERAQSTNPLQLIDSGFTQAELKPSNLSKREAEAFCGEGGGCLVPALDFKVANAGEGPVIVKRADLRVKKIWTFEAPYTMSDNCAAAFLASSFDYEVELPTEGVPYTVSRNLSQAIGSGETDRFTIAPRRDERTAKPAEDYVFLLTASLVYGADDEVVSGEDVIYGELAGSNYSYRPGECWTPREGLSKSEVAELRTHNERAAREIERIEAPNNASLEDLLQQVS